MKIVILAGGFGTRLSEETDIKPKPMVEIGGKPILWHIMKMYSSFGFNEFIICLGYKGYMIKEYFANYALHMSDVTIDMANNQLVSLQRKVEPWKVSLIDTGDNSMTGGRLKRIAPFIDKTFALTYGDGLSNININDLLKFHEQNKKIATLTAVRPSGRFGALELAETRVMAFKEKPKDGESWINGGFFILEPEIFDYIDGDETVWEREPLERLADEGNLAAYKFNGFWQAMDTLRDKRALQEMWESGSAPWKNWE